MDLAKARKKADAAGGAAAGGPAPAEVRMVKKGKGPAVADVAGAIREDKQNLRLSDLEVIFAAAVLAPVDKAEERAEAEKERGTT